MELMELERILFYLLLLHGFFYLVQTPFYGFQESNRPTFLMGLLFVFLAFVLPKGVTWVNWGILILPLTSFVAVFSSFSESLKPAWLKYSTMILNILLMLGALWHLLA
jgi:hypothetical protein